MVVPEREPSKTSSSATRRVQNDELHRLKILILSSNQKKKILLSFDDLISFWADHSLKVSDLSDCWELEG